LSKSKAINQSVKTIHLHVHVIIILHLYLSIIAITKKLRFFVSIEYMFNIIYVFSLLILYINLY